MGPGRENWNIRTYIMTAEGKHEVRIHIDRQPYQSPTPTTGEALYNLADIGKHKELFKEATGDHEDKPVARDHTELHLHQDDHFYSEKEEAEKKVHITVDRVAKTVRAGDWLVSALKAEVGVDAAKVLAQIKPHELVDLDDAAHIKVHDGEKFMSHARTGASS